MKKGLILVAVLAVTLGITTAASGRVQALITGAQIKDGSIESQDLEDRTILTKDLSKKAVAALRGNRGPRGFAGARGAAGATGPAGPAGPVGARGPTGATGSTGATGAQGVKGDTGAGVQIDGSVAAVVDLPACTVVGSAYIVTTTGDLHICNGTAWINAGPVRGPQGATGATGATGAQGAQGAQGIQGIQGPPGADGADGALAGYEIVNGTLTTVLASQFDVTMTVNCPTGKVAVGGGVTVTDPAGGLLMVQSKPTALGAGWSVTVANFANADNTATAHAVCANS